MNMTAKKYSLAATVAGAGIAIGVAFGSISGVALAEERPNDETKPPATEYAVNDNGQTFGSGAIAAEVGVSPDLIGVVATNGKLGYALQEDINGPVPSSPEEAISLSKSAHEARTVPVYDEDGKTVIGEFQIGGAVPFELE